jgi:hypothetical protein
MLTPVTFFVAVALAVFSYSQGQGGPVAGLVFFGVLFLGALIHVTCPRRTEKQEASEQEDVKFCEHPVRWFFHKKVENVPVCSCGAVIAVVFFVLVLIAGVCLGHIVQDVAIPPEEVCEKVDLDEGQVQGKDVQEICDAVDKKMGDAKRVADGYFLAGVVGLLLAFANMVARGFTPAGFTAATLGTGIVFSRLVVSELSTPLIIVVFVVGLVAVLIFRERLKVGAA